MAVEWTMGPECTIAIVGIGGLFPGSESLEQFWSNIRCSVDSTTDIPAGRWLIGPDEAFDPRIALEDHVYLKRGGFVNRPHLDPEGFDLDGSILERLDPLFRLSLYVAREAWRDARTDLVDRVNVGVVFGNIVLPTETASAFSRELLDRLFCEELGVPAADTGLAEPLNAFPAGLPAALVARALGLRGTAYTLDAACGSSLYALKLAADELLAGRADAMLCGGVSCPEPFYTQMGFSQLRALSARGRAAPLDHHADGLVVAEGAGMFVLKRLDDALRHGDHVYGIVAGIGIANDIDGDLLAPSAEGQLRAMRMAYDQAGWKPDFVDLIECHATGTPVGDSVEIQSLKLLWEDIAGPRGRCVIGSVKSNIGHALTAAGAAGLLKLLLALKSRLLPPTANFKRPAPGMGLEESPFRVLTRAEPWPARAPGLPRRAAISGFGFGGVNVHVLIEEWAPSADGQPASRSPSVTGNARHPAAGAVAIVGMSAHFGPFEGKMAFQERVLGNGETIVPAQPRNWWGIPESEWFQRMGWNDRSFPGYSLESLELHVDRFRIPPKELGEMLPQQSLMLRVAAEAALDAGWDVRLALRTAVLIGIGLDWSTTDYHLRWSLAERALEWSKVLGLRLAPDQLAGWVAELRRAAGPALSANRTTGSLGGLIASRIARALRIGGPSFTVSCDETSGIEALNIAAGWLAQGELDAAIVGAVDFANDIRGIMARHQPLGGSSTESSGTSSSPCCCDGAVSLVLKRLEDAQRDGDRIYAVVRKASSGWRAETTGPSFPTGAHATVGFLDVQRAGWIPAVEGEAKSATELRSLAALCPGPGATDSCAIGSIQNDLGWAGAATGLAAVAKVAICLDQQVLPGARAGIARLSEIAALPLAVFIPAGPRFWPRSRTEGPRRAAVSASSLGGRCQHVVLEECKRRPIETIGGTALIERAYADGIEVLMEMRPAAARTRLVADTLGRRPHVACLASPPDGEAPGAMLNALGALIAASNAGAINRLHGPLTGADRAKTAAIPPSDKPSGPKIRIDVRGKSFSVPRVPSAGSSQSPDARRGPTARSREAPRQRVPPTTHELAPDHRATGPGNNWETSGHESTRAEKWQPLSLSRLMPDSERSTGAAHKAFLRLAQMASALMGEQLELQRELLESWYKQSLSAGQSRGRPLEKEAAKTPIGLGSEPVFLDREKCLEFAVGTIAGVLGPEFSPVDGFPTRVRLPNEPLMLVDRIIRIEAIPRSFQSGRVITEHVIQPGAWYLDGGRIAASIAIEAGQADLFLSAYLGVDFETCGTAVYRLLDATVTFHRSLPAPRAVIRYDIRITGFFRQAKTIMFRFQFDATIAGEPLLSMRDGCAGFFTPEELASGRGIVPRALEEQSIPAPRIDELSPLLPISPTRLDEHQIDALRRGDLATAFGPPFDRVELDDPLPLPGGRMTLVHRVKNLDPSGGRCRLGIVRAQTDIHSGDWFMACHFVDDRVMPGTLMYESCLHALRIFLMRSGAVGPRGESSFEPVPGIAARLRCRGQVVESTSVVDYEVAIKQRGYRPEPFAIADAIIFGDGKPIVEIENIALRLSGTDREALARLWKRAATGAVGESATDAMASELPRPAGLREPVCDHHRILAFAVGKPSEAFGAPYRIFDDGRFVARFPGPPYQFLHRITRVEGEPFVMCAGGSAEAEYDVDAQSWFFQAARQVAVPFAILLEIALQSCGWMAAYMGSALTSDDDLTFRNLGGNACQHRPVTQRAGTLTTRVRVLGVSRTAEMILQRYEFAVRSRDGLIYDGVTEFGFFHPRALMKQVGIRGAAQYEPHADEQTRAESFLCPNAFPFPEPSWRMIEQIDLRLADGGPHGLGLVRGSTRVDPGAWFFKAHFKEDPVWPGSLGLESIVQLLKAVAVAQWDVSPGSAFESPVLALTHHWTYRGQIIPSNSRVTVQAEIKRRDDRRRLLVADGYLSVDGKVIYQVNDFSLRQLPTSR
jgi:acyl transferase domain-containing protein/3-hydroxymyristoyl/3-hydroxydecanoyl-(acyl carrier protein) dehydratase